MQVGVPRIIKDVSIVVRPAIVGAVKRRIPVHVPRPWITAVGGVIARLRHWTVATDMVVPPSTVAPAAAIVAVATSGNLLAVQGAAVCRAINSAERENRKQECIHERDSSSDTAAAKSWGPAKRRDLPS